jgi:hypothetical protein
VTTQRVSAERERTEVRLLEPSEFARVISWHPESVRRAIRQGRIGAVRMSNGWRIPSAEAERILANGLPAQKN